MIPYFLTLLIYLALNAFIFRFYFGPRNADAEHQSRTARQSRFSMNLLNITVIATVIAIWSHRAETLEYKLLASAFLAVGLAFVYVHTRLMRKMVREADYILGHILNVIVFLSVLVLMITY